MNDQRKETRKKLMAFTPVYDARERSLLGYIGNLNLRGVMLVGEHALEISKAYSLHVELPSSLAEQEVDKLTLSARVAWCKAEDAVKSFTVGFEFTELKPEQEAIIQAILERYHFRYNE
ncbi:MAG: PilZ domain-containing protein [Anaerolineales bacterium]|nr:PilZ domain-containing protein [Anaerolineales bacterium]